MKDLSFYFLMRERLKTGDMVLFSNWDAAGCVIKLFQWGGPTHVGMVIRDDCWDTFSLLESTGLNTVADLFTGVRKNGVNLSPLSERLRTYSGTAKIRMLNKPLGESRTLPLRDFVKDVRHEHYERSLFELARAAFGKSSGEDMSSIFCSELFVKALKVAGLMEQSVPSNSYAPKHLDVGGKFALLDGYQYDSGFDV